MLGLFMMRIQFASKTPPSLDTVTLLNRVWRRFFFGSMYPQYYWISQRITYCGHHGLLDKNLKRRCRLLWVMCFWKIFALSLMEPLKSSFSRSKIGRIFLQVVAFLTLGLTLILRLTGCVLTSRKEPFGRTRRRKDRIFE